MYHQSFTHCDLFGNVSSCHSPCRDMRHCEAKKALGRLCIFINYEIIFLFFQNMRHGYMCDDVMRIVYGYCPFLQQQQYIQQCVKDETFCLYLLSWVEAMDADTVSCILKTCNKRLIHSAQTRRFITIGSKCLMETLHFLARKKKLHFAFGFAMDPNGL